MLWMMMREAAICRHWYVNRVFEFGCPYRWQLHMAVVRAVYGW